MNNRINDLISTKKDILSIYFTAGYPALNDTLKIIEKLVEEGVDLIEVGVPFSDPVADGPVIQKSNTKAIENGMTVERLFDQLSGLRELVDIPIIMMSSINPILRFGFENFCKKCHEIGADGLIIPDLPVEEYEEQYKAITTQYDLMNILLITPSTVDDRIAQIDDCSEGFIYMVSSSSTTGNKKSFEDDFGDFATRIEQMNLKNKCITGFGIHDRNSFDKVCEYSVGGIIGSAFVDALVSEEVIEKSIASFMRQFERLKQ